MRVCEHANRDAVLALQQPADRQIWNWPTIYIMLIPVHLFLYPPTDSREYDTRTKRNASGATRFICPESGSDNLQISGIRWSRIESYLPRHTMLVLYDDLANL
jgi:hypothetical protein